MLLLSLAPAAAGEIETVGVWVEDFGSRDFHDATLVIERHDGRYVFVRCNAARSCGRHPLERKGNVYERIGDRYGTRYVITPLGLELHDARGYLRTAQPKP